MDSLINNFTLPRIFLSVTKPSNPVLGDQTQIGGGTIQNEQNENITSNTLKEILNDYTGSFGNSLISMYEMMKVIEASN